ncbi:unnamed protein product [Protopolystoma xenopodis]|uniref:Uncharacterized protein n=1 Tax=Protopolystoma xenopodis TaxID=117903 RepID=A0A448X0T3_9PLAT|nr:unnamed protein product [Protopolystoma xenopodis]
MSTTGKDSSTHNQDSAMAITTSKDKRPTFDFTSASLHRGSCGGKLTTDTYGFRDDYQLLQPSGRHVEMDQTGILAERKAADRSGLLFSTLSTFAQPIEKGVAHEGEQQNNAFETVLGNGEKDPTYQSQAVLLKTSDYCQLRADKQTKRPTFNKLSSNPAKSTSYQVGMLQKRPTHSSFRSHKQSVGLIIYALVIRCCLLSSRRKHRNLDTCNIYPIATCSLVLAHFLQVRPHFLCKKTTLIGLLRPKSHSTLMVSAYLSPD